MFPKVYDEVRDVILHVERIDSEEGSSATKLKFVIVEAVDRVPGEAKVVCCSGGFGVGMKALDDGVDETSELSIKLFAFNTLISLIEEFDPGVLRLVPSPCEMHSA